MQWAENDPDAFFRFSLGKTSLFAVSASESRSVRFSGARNATLWSMHFLIGRLFHRCLTLYLLLVADVSGDYSTVHLSRT
ncbi:hypothetical protein KVP58_24905, partial [Salmonella sp. LSP 245/13]|uniref:hypothetical protein n=1 Tax=Salmonella sp. LSP 245/13 TaxID=2854158 RepID=UPI003EE87EC3